MNLEVSEEIVKQTFELFKEDAKYNVFAINDFVREFLYGFNERKISELDLKDNYELIMLVCIMMYSKLPNSIYDIILLDTDVYKNAYS